MTKTFSWTFGMTLGLFALAAMLVGSVQIAFANHEVTVTIHKYVDGVHADTTNAGGQSFPMTATWDSTSHGSGSGPFSLSSPSYDALTVHFNTGADYSASEDFDESSVGASCADGKPFALVGYTSGDTEVAAAAGVPTTTPPQLVDMTTNKHIIVWNENCMSTLTVTKIVVNDNGGTATTSDFVLFIDNATTTSGIATTTTAGAHVVSETASSSYSSTIGGDCDAQGNVTLAAGDNKTCTITNNDVASNVTVTIHKYIAGVHASTTNAQGLSFPMASCWSATNIGTGCGTFSLGPTGFNNPTPYDATTASMSSGADYSTNEDQSGNNVGANCSEGKPFALAGYSTGETEGAAAGSSVATTSPAFTNITTDKHVIVWNVPCVPPPPPPPANACSNLQSAPAGYTLQNGTTGNDNVTLTPGTMFVGKGGNDTVSGPDGNYIVCTGSGNDIVTLGNGDYTINVGGGNNTVTTGNGSGPITSGSGTDLITVGDGAHTINAGGGSNTITTGNGVQNVTTLSGNDKITTGSGNDTISAGGGNNTVKSDGGDDSITTLSGNDNIDGGTGTDSCSAGGGLNTVTNCP